MERDKKIFKGQCLNLAMQFLKGKDVLDLNKLFDLADQIYKKGIEKDYLKI